MEVAELSVRPLIEPLRESPRPEYALLKGYQVEEEKVVALDEQNAEPVKNFSFSLEMKEEYSNEIPERKQNAKDFADLIEE